MFEEYLFGRMFSSVEISMFYMLFVAALGAGLVFRECRRKSKIKDELPKLYRRLTFCAECCGMVALFGIATLFGRSLVTHDKDVLEVNRKVHSEEISRLSWEVQDQYCRHRESGSYTLLFRENFTPICSIVNLRGWHDTDVDFATAKIKEIERLSVLGMPPPSLHVFDELKLHWQGVVSTQQELWRKHGAWTDEKQSFFSVVLLLIALLCALVAVSIKAGKACYEWYAGR